MKWAGSPTVLFATIAGAWQRASAVGVLAGALIGLILGLLAYVVVVFVKSVNLDYYRRLEAAQKQEWLEQHGLAPGHATEQLSSEVKAITEDRSALFDLENCDTEMINTDTKGDRQQVRERGGKFKTKDWKHRP